MNCFDSKIERGIIGFALRRSVTTKAIRRRAPRTAVIATVAALRPSDALISEKVAAASPVAARTAPGMSSRPVAVGSRRLGYVAVGHEHDESANGQVDEEDPPPGHRIDQIAAEKRPDGRGDPAQPRPRADRASPILGMERGLDDREAPRREERAADALEDAGGDQELRARRERAQGRGEGEPDDPDVEDETPAHPVAQRTAQEDEGRERQEVAVEDPLEIAGRRAKVAPDLGHARRLQPSLPRTRSPTRGP